MNIKILHSYTDSIQIYIYIYIRGYVVRNAVFSTIAFLNANTINYFCLLVSKAYSNQFVFIRGSTAHSKIIIMGVFNID